MMETKVFAAKDSISIVTYYYYRFTMDCGAIRKMGSAIISLDMRDIQICLKFN